MEIDLRFAPGLPPGWCRVQDRPRTPTRNPGLGALHSVGPSIRPICTRCCLTMTYVIQQCSKPEYLCTIKASVSGEWTRSVRIPTDIDTVGFTTLISVCLYVCAYSFLYFTDVFIQTHLFDFSTLISVSSHISIQAHFPTQPLPNACPHTVSSQQMCPLPPCFSRFFFQMPFPLTKRVSTQTPAD